MTDTNRAPWVLALSSLALGAACVADSLDLAEDEQEIINGYADYGDQNRNAAVWVGGCSGALVAPDMVLTAAHCLGGRASAWEDDATVGRGAWRTLGADIEIRIGPNPASPVSTTWARWSNVAGFDDIALLLLTERVPNVRPAKIMNAAELDRVGGLEGKTLYNPGYGSECRSWLAPRAYGYVRYDGGTPRGVNTFRGQFIAYDGQQPRIEGGDSGSPLFWWNGSEARLYLVGIALGYSGGSACSDNGRIQPHYIAPFGTGAGDPAKPDISAWLDAQVNQTMRRTTFQPFAAGDRWHDFFCIDSEVCGTGDFDGDGKDDIITFTRGSAGDVYVGRSYGFRTPSSSSFLQPGRGFESRLWHASFGYNSEIVGVLDIDRDGRADVFAGSSTAVWIARSSGTAFGTSYRAITTGICNPTTKVCAPGEIRRDTGGADLLSIDRASGAATVYRSSGGYLYADSFDTSAIAGACIPPRQCTLKDMDGDGDDDLVIVHADAYGHVDIATNLSSRFAAPVRWVNNACYVLGGFRRTCSLGDVDGNGRPDLVIADHAVARVHVVRNGHTSVEQRWHANLCGDGHVCMAADFNGDGLDDVVDFARSAASATVGDVFVQTSIATY
jgi:hypothetical protein